MELILFRAMSNKEFKILKNKGFNYTFKRRYKWFAQDLRYISIVMNEVGYGKCPEMKYHNIIKFIIKLKEITPLKWLHLKKEREFINIGMHYECIKYIDNIKFEELNKDKLPKLKPVLKWQSQNGKIVELYDINKAKKIINEMNKRGLSRIIYLDDLVVK
jgi:hypothetical protein